MHTQIWVALQPGAGLSLSFPICSQIGTAEHLLVPRTAFSVISPPLSPQGSRRTPSLSTSPCRRHALASKMLAGCPEMAMHACMLSRFSHVLLFANLWTVTPQVSVSLGFSRQGYWSGLPRPPLGDLPNPGIQPASPMSPALVGRFFTTITILEAPLPPYLPEKA